MDPTIAKKGAMVIRRRGHASFFHVSASTQYWSPHLPSSHLSLLPYSIDGELRKLKFSFEYQIKLTQIFSLLQLVIVFSCILKHRLCKHLKMTVCVCVCVCPLPSPGYKVFTCFTVANHLLYILYSRYLRISVRYRGCPVMYANYQYVACLMKWRVSSGT